MAEMSEQEMRELDAWIGVNVFGKKAIHRDSEPPTEGTEDDYFVIEYINISGSLPHYSTSNADAMLVLQQCIPKASLNAVSIHHTSDHGDPWTVREVTQTIEERPIIIDSETLPIAICLFAKALYSK